MNIKIDYEDGIASINKSIQGLPETLQEKEKVVLKKIGNSIKKNVIKYMRVSDIEQRAKNVQPSNYDGSKPYVNMKNDVKRSVRKDKSGNYYVSVRGGKMTGFKWGPVSDGHIARDGTTFVQGDHFMQRAVSASAGDVDRMIDAMIKEIVDD